MTDPWLDLRGTVFPATVFATMLTIGMELRLAQFRTLLANPRLPLLGTLIHTAMFPMIAALLVSAAIQFDFGWSDAMLIGVLLIAACPSGGFSNVLVLLARADLPLSVLLTVISCLLSFATVPLLFAALGTLMTDVPGSISLPVGATLTQLSVLVLLPVAAGMLWRGLYRDFVERVTTSLQRYAQLALYLVVGAMLVADWATVSVGLRESLPWGLLLCSLVLACGYGCSRAASLPHMAAVTIAIEGAARNLAVAFLIASSVLGRMDVAALPSVYFIAVVVLGLLFARLVRWTRRRA